MSKGHRVHPPGGQGHAWCSAEDSSHLLASPLLHPPGSHQAHMANPMAGHLEPQHWRVKGPPGLHVCSSLLPLRLVEGLLPLGWFSASTAAPALTHSLAASSGISGKGRGSGDFCCFSWDQRSVPTPSRGRRPGRRKAIGMVTPGGLTSCVLPKKPAPGGCWPGERRPQAPWLAARMDPGKLAGLSAPEPPPAPPVLLGPSLPSRPASFLRADGRSGGLQCVPGHRQPSCFQIFICEPGCLTVRCWIQTSLGLPSDALPLSCISKTSLGRNPQLWDFCFGTLAKWLNSSQSSFPYL